MAISTKATLRLKISSDKQLTTLIEALMPEAKALASRRASVKLERDGVFFVLTVDAEDTVALRSTLNAYLRWINSTINIMNMVEHA